ncbi:MAG: hypothetical protein OXF07_15310 [Rhodobacter sp.]|nr:hypothetical protein [Rhodobacter sp.]MCY4169944.1 hypothetical protein [Rhodobacter sp.]MCY4243019.1 hypothetical protein [Rhodobacter sp.]
MSTWPRRYDFMRIHGSLRVTPAKEAGLTDRIRDMEEFIQIMDDRAPEPNPRRPYRKRKGKDD